MQKSYNIAEQLMMASFSADNRDIVCYLVTKHSWKGKLVYMFRSDFLFFFYATFNFDDFISWIFSLYLLKISRKIDSIKCVN